MNESFMFLVCSYQRPYLRPFFLLLDPKIFVIVMNFVKVLLKQQRAPSSQLNLKTPVHDVATVSHEPPSTDREFLRVLRMCTMYIL